MALEDGWLEDRCHAVSKRVDLKSARREQMSVRLHHCLD
jgi:hypothetical protein